MSELHAIGLFPTLGVFVQQCQTEADQIPGDRKDELKGLAAYIREQVQESEPVQLTFICTHNSRRSHLAQIWAKVAADLFGVQRVRTFSGGTEATAMNPRVVDSLKRTGFQVVVKSEEDQNPIYSVRYAEHAEPLQCFSKVYNQSPNPTARFAAVMTCSSADQACPFVPGCDLRLPIRYEDPKVSDGTSQEAEIYDERSQQIAREMLYAMSLV
ncbi:arsenate-mycothiol transferase ArsC [Rhodopirellula sp. P2]|uniref:arsenate-mycothiol transferase ArsC n=1 Tax=Rhodopirellula sp. P2 TaxID=2127060 RepID=UPI002367F87F|nr:protein-tyrosine-phosphatase [Rhodopirellula sp. P2]WDQ17206.1 protein-tyrosine-phosphatase [Rhodopirellula sp. P2]